MRHSLAPILSGLLVGACSVIGVRDGTEEPAYRVIGHAGTIEIREYAARIAAETTLDGNEVATRGDGFRRLAGYIFGGNTTRTSIAMTAPVAQADSKASEKIAMTAPVAQNQTPAGTWTIRFFMPAKYTLETLPMPNDSRVRLVPVPAQSVAVLRFTGSTAPDAIAARQTELARALAGAPWRVTGPATAWFYDPPWTIPFLRRNEVVAPVERDN